MKTHFLQLVDQLTFDIALVIFNFYIRKFFLQFWQITFEGVAAINARFTDTEKVQVWAIDNCIFIIPYYFIRL